MKILLLFLMLMGCSLTYGQTVVSKDNYEKAVDALNCKTVRMSLYDDDKDDYNKYIIQVPCDENVSFSQINDFLAKNSLSKTIQLAQEINGLKEEFKPEWKPNEAAGFLSDDIFRENSKYKNLAEFAGKRKDRPDFLDFKNQLKTYISTLLSGNQLAVDSNRANNNSTSNAKGAKTPAVANTATVPNSGDSVSMMDSIFSWIPLIGGGMLFLILIAGFFYLYQEMTNLSRKLESLRRDIKSSGKDKSNPITVYKGTSSDSPTPDNLKLLVNDLIKEALNNQGKGNQPASEVMNRQKQDEWERHQEQQLRQRRIQEREIQDRQELVYKPQQAREILYFSNPNKDGSFNNKSASTLYKEGATIYKFTKLSPTLAEFQIDDKESSMKMALEFPDVSIDPVCEAQNAYNPKGNIVTVPDGLGRAELEGDKWVVRKKALIKYEV